MRISNQAFYGSKLFPLSAAKSAEGIKSRPRYEELNDRDLREVEGEDLYLDEELEAWEERKDEWDVYFAEVEGWQRTYTVERPSEYGGNMLDAEFTGNPDDSMIVALLGGVSDEEMDEIESSEDIYEKTAVSSGELEFIGERPDEVPEEVLIYSGGDHEAFNEDTEEFRSEVYHERILAGLESMAEEEIIGSETAEKARKNYRNQTRERWKLSDELSPETEKEVGNSTWNSVARNEEIEGAARLHGHRL